MSLHKLYIFGKNRDAIAAQKGYSYQQLKTLEDWIENRVIDGDEDIYCDFEDDILARDLSKNKTTFKQIKLYSSDFSFSSESIKKAIVHFFSMYSKGEYSFDELEFHFETNVSVVGKTVKGNDAELLDEWSKNQHNLSADLLQRVRVRIKKILSENVEKRIEELKTSVDLKADVQIARNVYDNLKDEDFDGFIRAIKWQFDGEETNQALQNILYRIDELIAKIPLPLDGGKTEIYRSLLISEVFHRSIQDEPEERRLTKELLDAVLLNAGDKEDKWYAEAIRQFSTIGIEHFYQGEFQTVVTAASYCRWNQLDKWHIDFWLGLLKQYINLDLTPTVNKRKAIYEYLFLKIGHDLLGERASSPIAGDKDLISYYFETWKPPQRILDLEDDIVLLQLIKTQILAFGLSLSVDFIVKWEETVKNYLDHKVKEELNVDRLCELFEMQGHLAHQSNILNPVESYEMAFEYYRKIPPLLEKAQYYSLARLFNQMKQMIKMLTKYGFNSEILELTDQFMIEIQDYAEKTGLRHKAALDFVERGILHLSHHDFPNYLKALELFQKAKDKWRLEYTKEQYVVSLLGIAEVYEGLGMSYASKYYSLITFWSAWHFADPSLYKYLQQALSQVLLLDHKHGAWMNAINDFSHYLIAKREFDERDFRMEGDESYQEALFAMASIIHAAPIIHPAMAELIESLKRNFGFVWREQILPLVEELTQKVTTVKELKRILNHNLIDAPLNDVGRSRKIRFHALSNEWYVQFDNTEAMRPIGEEFVSVLQIALTEIARINPGILYSGKHISITIEEGHFQKQIVESDSWLLTVPQFDRKEQPEIQMHYSYIGSLVRTVIQNVSNLSKSAFMEFYIEELLKKGQFGEKALEVASYQRVFRNTVGLSSAITEEKYELPPFEIAGYFTSYRNWLTK